MDSLGDFSGTLDYYSFYVPIAGTRIYADIDCGQNLSGTDSGCAGYGGGTDSIIQLFDPSGTLVASNDDDFSGDIGSESSGRDSYFDFSAPVAGVWTVAVGEYPPPLTAIGPGEDYILHLPEPGRAGLIASAVALALVCRRRAIATAGWR